MWGASFLLTFFFLLENFRSCNVRYLTLPLPYPRMYLPLRRRLAGNGIPQTKTKLLRQGRNRHANPTKQTNKKKLRKINLIAIVFWKEKRDRGSSCLCCTSFSSFNARPFSFSSYLQTRSVQFSIEICILQINYCILNWRIIIRKNCFVWLNCANIRSYVNSNNNNNSGYF